MYEEEADTGAIEETPPRFEEAQPDYAPGENIEQLYTRNDVMLICRLSKSSLRRLVLSGEFPPPLNISNRVVRWRRSDILTWQESL